MTGGASFCGWMTGRAGAFRRLREARVFQAVDPGVDAEGAAEPREDGRILQLRRGLGRAGGVLAAVLAGQGAVAAVEGAGSRYGDIAAACKRAKLPVPAVTSATAYVVLIFALLYEPPSPITPPT